MRSVVTDVWCGYFTGQLSSWHLLCCEEGKFDVCRFYFAFLLLTFPRKQLEEQFTFWSIFWQTGYCRMVCNCYVSPREVMLLVLHRTRRSFRNSQIEPLWSQIDPLCFQARALSRSQNTKRCCPSQQLTIPSFHGGNSPKEHDCFSSLSRPCKFGWFLNLSCFGNRSFAQFFSLYLAFCMNVFVVESKSKEMWRIAYKHN